MFRSSIIIPLRIDHNDRYINAEIVLNYLIKYCSNMKIYVIENGKQNHFQNMKIENKQLIEYTFQYNDENLFHRMKIINELLACVHTKNTFIYDIDCLLPVSTFIKVEEMLEHCQIVKPFSNPPGCMYIHPSNKSNITSDIEGYALKQGDTTGFAGNGFIVCVDTKTYKEIGGENELFKAYGPEDNERYYRFEKLGYVKGEIKNNVYHLEHYRTPNSSHNNPYFKDNNNLFEKIKRMSKEELIEYYRRI